MLDLQKTLFCGQCFRWRKTADGLFAGVANGRFLCLSQRDVPQLRTDAFWRTYFDLDTAYDALAEEIASLHPRLREAVQYGMGIHLLRQDPWEALCSFILSQNNNIPRIQGIIQRLCGGTDPLPQRALGLVQCKTAFPFPRPEQLAGLSVADLAPLRAGFRAKYVLDAARKVADGTVPLEALRTAPLQEARQVLMQINGVGPKVADCTLLYGLHRMEVFPVDVWMRRVLQQWFPGVPPDRFGPAAGLAQQYLFAYARGIRLRKEA